jgi:hypothetical protein
MCRVDKNDGESEGELDRDRDDELNGNHDY